MESRPIGLIALFAAFTLATSGGLLLFKYAWPGFQSGVASGSWLSRSALLVAVGAGLYAASFVLWLVIASRIALTIAYPVAIGLSLVAITTGATLWLGETITLARASGAALIVAGIVLIVR